MPCIHTGKHKRYPVAAVLHKATQFEQPDTIELLQGIVLHYRSMVAERCRIIVADKAAVFHAYYQGRNQAAFVISAYY